MIEGGGQGRSGGSGFGAGVVPLQVRPSSQRSAVLETVARYWDALRGGRLLPLRSEIDPRGIETALDVAFIVERIAPGIARFRLAGTHLVDLMGAEVRGMPLSVMFTPDARRPLAEAVEAVFAGPETLRLDLVAERGIGRPVLSGQMILLPLRSDLGDVTRALGCLSTGGAIGRAPRRFGIAAASRTDLLGQVGLAGPWRMGAPAGREAGGMPHGLAPTLRPVPGAPHLRLVETAR